MILGVVLAGGQSSRFGSDKALAELDGATLLARAVDSLSAWCEKVVVVGREEAPAPTLPDWPRPGMGPLGGIAAALHWGRDKNFGGVGALGLAAGGLQDDLPALFAPGPAYLASQPVIGLWPVSAAAAVEDILRGTGKHSLRALAERTGARAVRLEREPANINTEADLAALRDRAGEKRNGL